MARLARSNKQWVSSFVLILLLESVISCTALEEAKKRRQERRKKELAAHVPSSETPRKEFPLRGQPAPLFTLQDLTGNQVSLGAFKGKPVVINFWATWCGPCRMEIPHLEKLSKKYKSRDLVVIGLNNETNHQQVRTFSQAEISYTVLLNGDSEFLRYGVRGIPCTYYLDENGIVRDRDVGFPGEAEMEKKIIDLLKNYEMERQKS